jgi:N-acetylneuraminate synthase
MSIPARDRVFIIAEAGVNHNGSPELALRLVDAAAAAGADAVKFQKFRAEALASATARKADYQSERTAREESQLDMLRKLELDSDAHRALVARCGERGIEFMSSAFDHESLAFLAEGLDVARLKIPSGEITNAPLLLAAARYGRPLIVSTGMSTLDEIEAALGVLALGLTRAEAAPSREAFSAAYASAGGRARLSTKVTLLQCTTEYPAPMREANLRAMDTLRRRFDLAVGYSDHTEGTAAALAAAALGATVIEKHLTLDRAAPGPDHAASLEPREFEAMVRAVREVEDALGTGVKVAGASELRNLAAARRSLVAARAIRRDEAFTEENLAVKRPGGGLSPFLYWEWLGRRAGRDYAKDEAIEP